jgi:hypothetical protein
VTLPLSETVLSSTDAVGAVLTPVTETVTVSVSVAVPSLTV